MANYSDSALVVSQGTGNHVAGFIEEGKNPEQLNGAAASGVELFTPRNLAAYEQADSTKGIAKVTQLQPLPVIGPSWTQVFHGQNADIGTAAEALVSSPVTISSVNTTTNEVTSTAHGLSTGVGVYVTNSGGALPGGFSATTKYFVRAVGADTLTFHSSPDEAINNTNALDITSSGSGTNTVNIAVQGGVMIKAMVANTDNIYIGGAGVTTGTGWELDAGQEVFWSCKHLGEVFCIAGVNGENVCYVGVS